ncbi:M16 family metallopeptidase [Labrys monachus]|uniref:Zn-dependent peptidase n=1 Tax=Labrys monachus TaxID=217067 RepID=A0ABU0FAA2_9HYPH|nr:pitrilysin family protein [Labrys monachus]MDQ0391552.1 putative Zn-dependent peptidase [Labrys monachus]
MSLKVTVLPSGLTVITDAMPHLETAALGVFAGAGARSEGEAEHGLAHLLEHMAFKGTTRRDARRIAEEIESAGGELNAATSAEQTAYYARTLKEDVGLGLDILADILTESIFDEDELTREKNVILQEISAVEDTPDDLVFDMFNQAAFPDQPIGRPILGTPDSVMSFDRDAIRSYLDTHYRAGRMVVAAAGAVDHDRIVEDSTRLFAGLPTDKGPAPVSARYHGGEFVVDTDHEQANVLIGFAGRSYRDAASPALGVFTNVLGGGMSSRLFQEVREKRGLCYSIYAFQWAYADTGIFGISAGAGAEDLADLVPVILDTIEATAQAPGEAEVARAKAQMKAGLLMSLESSSVRAEQLARHILTWGRPLSAAELIAKVDAVTVADVRNAGLALLASAPTLAALGPVSTLPRLDSIRTRLAA